MGLTNADLAWIGEGEGRVERRVIWRGRGGLRCKRVVMESGSRGRCLPELREEGIVIIVHCII